MQGKGTLLFHIISILPCKSNIQCSICKVKTYHTPICGHHCDTSNYRPKLIHNPPQHLCTKNHPKPLPTGKRNSYHTRFSAHHTPKTGYHKKPVFYFHISSSPLGVECVMSCLKLWSLCPLCCLCVLCGRYVALLSRSIKLSRIAHMRKKCATIRTLFRIIYWLSMLMCTIKNFRKKCAIPGIWHHITGNQ